MNSLGLIAKILMIIGAINWGLYGLMGLDLVALILGGIPLLAKLVYILVGLAGLYCLFNLVTKKGCCN